MTDLVLTGASWLLAPVGADGARTAIAPTHWAAAPAKLARMDRLCGLALVAADGALVDAAATPADWEGPRTALVLGTAYGCHATNEEFYRGLLAHGPAGASPRLFATTLPSSPVGEVSIHYSVQGPASTVAAGLTAGLDALADGLRHLRRGRADRALVMAAEVATPLLARLLASSELAFAPVDAAAAVLLERTGHAAARGATPRGRVLGTGAAFVPGARAAAVAEAARRALAEADLGPGAIARLLAAPVDAEAVRALGVAAPGPDSDEHAGALGAAPLVRIARWLAEPDGLTLALAGDPEGGGAAALLAPAGDGA